MLVNTLTICVGSFLFLSITFSNNLYFES